MAGGDRTRSRRRRGRGAGWVVVAVAAAGPMAAGALEPAPAPIQGAAEVAVAATRLERPALAYDIVMVGDSLTSTARAPLSEAFRATGWSTYLDGRASRSISYPEDTRYSGVDTVRALRGAGIDADTWVIALGANDLFFVDTCECPDQAVFAADRIRLILAEIDPTRAVVWVAPQNFEYSRLAAVFDGALASLLATGEIDAVVPWRTVSADRRRDWFSDEVHLTVTGTRAWIDLIVGSIPTA